MLMTISAKPPRVWVLKQLAPNLSFQKAVYAPRFKATITVAYASSWGGPQTPPTRSFEAISTPGPSNKYHAKTKDAPTKEVHYARGWEVGAPNRSFNKAALCIAFQGNYNLLPRHGGGVAAGCWIIRHRAPKGTEVFLIFEFRTSMSCCKVMHQVYN